LPKRVFKRGAAPLFKINPPLQTKNKRFTLMPSLERGTQGVRLKKPGEKENLQGAGVKSLVYNGEDKSGSVEEVA